MRSKHHGDPGAVHWSVEVRRNGENLVTIESNSLSGKPEFTEDEEDTIRHCANHLLSFIGEALSSTGRAWEPIDTAPKDRLILICRTGDDDVTVGWWAEAVESDSSEYDNSLNAGWFGQSGFHPSGDPDDQPLYWMEKPAPPLRDQPANKS